jgi:AraC-like DNA-binding protein
VITKAKAFIREHHAEKLCLGQVAKLVNTSPSHFCRMFKNCAALSFTDYLSIVRIERSRNLMLNPNLRMSEIAYEVGFQSLNSFSRVFKKRLGQSPTRYRSQLWGNI